MPERTDALTPDELFDLTARYYSFGHHRTGTDADLATADWFFGRLGDLGATLHRRQVPFDRYDAHTELVDVEGEAIPSEPVFYEFIGSFAGSDVATATASVNGVGHAGALNGILEDRDGPRVIVVEDGPPGHVVMPNRAVGEAQRPPAVLVPSDAADRLRGASLTVEATFVPGICEASSAVLGDGPPVTVTTPLSGWFGCASERGSGAAVALDLATRLADTHAVTLVACSGHELDHLGLDLWLEHAIAHEQMPSGPVIHLGASVASTYEGSLQPRVVLQDHTAPEDWLAELGDLVAPASYQVVPVSDPWPGEGRNWRPHTPHVLSFTGTSRWFHTTGDTPEQATTAAALGLARDAVWDATQAFLDRIT